MFVYVVEFEGRPGLVKIGMAVKVGERLKNLSICHGLHTSLTTYSFGANCRTVEAFIHRKFKGKNVLLEGRCDGYTEFFTSDIKAEVEGILQSILLNTETPDTGLAAKDKRAFSAPDGSKRLTINLPEALHKQLRQAALDRDCNATDIIVGLLLSELNLKGTNGNL